MTPQVLHTPHCQLRAVARKKLDQRALRIYHAPLFDIKCGHDDERDGNDDGKFVSAQPVAPLSAPLFE